VCERQDIGMVDCVQANTIKQCENSASKRGGHQESKYEEHSEAKTNRTDWWRRMHVVN
jgi:hypothetical protein